MDKFLKFFNLFRGGKEGLACNAIVDSEISPHRDFFAIGDIHGCYSSLASLLTKVESVSTGGEAMVFLGDFIDRGPESSRVLRKLYCLCLDAPEDIVVLMGNHERMMLEFIDDPLGNGGLWLRSGGIQTLESFGIKNVPENPDTDEAMDIGGSARKLASRWYARLVA